MTPLRAATRLLWTTIALTTLELTTLALTTLALATLAPAIATARPTRAAQTAITTRSPSTLVLAPAMTVGFAQVGGDLCATWTPELQLHGDGVELVLAPPLRVVAHSDRGDFGLRDRDWDERGEWLRPLQRLRLRSKDGDAALDIAGDLGLTLGHGALVDGARAGLLPDSYRAGVHGRLRAGPLQLEVYGDDATRFGVFAARLGVQPLGDRNGGAASGLSSWTLALETSADRDAPVLSAATATAGATLRHAPRVAGLVESSWTLIANQRLALRAFVGAGVVSHDLRGGWGLDAGLAFALRQAHDARPVVDALLAPVLGRGVWLPGGIDAGYQLERADLRGEPQSARLQRAAAQGGVGGGVRGALRWAPIAALQLRAEGRLLPETSGDDDVSAWALAARWQQASWSASAGWLRRPGGLHLVAAGGGLTIAPWLRVDLRLERAMHQGDAGAPLSPRWDVGLGVTASWPNAAAGG